MPQHRRTRRRQGVARLGALTLFALLIATALGGWQASASSQTAGFDPAGFSTSSFKAGDVKKAKELAKARFCERRPDTRKCQDAAPATVAAPSPTPEPDFTTESAPTKEADPATATTTSDLVTSESPSDSPSESPSPSPSESPSGWPTLATTGAKGTLTSTSINAFTNGATYSDVHITSASGGNIIYGDDLTFNNVQFMPGVIFRNADRVTCNDCTFPNGFGISSSSDITINRGQVVNFNGDAVHITSDGGYTCKNVTVRDSYIVESNPTGGAHADGFQVRGSSGLHLVNNYVDFVTPFVPYHNAGLFIEHANGGNTGFVVENNFFKGGGYTAYLTAGSGIVRNNTFAQGPYGYFYGGAAASGITGTGNVTEDGSPLQLR
jgi:hypothetical protein